MTIPNVLTFIRWEHRQFKGGSQSHFAGVLISSGPDQQVLESCATYLKIQHQLLLGNVGIKVKMPTQGA